MYINIKNFSFTPEKSVLEGKERETGNIFADFEAVILCSEDHIEGCYQISFEAQNANSREIIFKDKEKAQKLYDWIMEAFRNKEHYIEIDVLKSGGI